MMKMTGQTSLDERLEEFSSLSSGLVQSRVKTHATIIAHTPGDPIGDRYYRRPSHLVLFEEIIQECAGTKRRELVDSAQFLGLQVHREYFHTGDTDFNVDQLKLISSVGLPPCGATSALFQPVTLIPGKN